MGNGINKVLPHLYLGNFKDAQDRELLAQHNISHVLSIHDTAAPILEVCYSGGLRGLAPLVRVQSYWDEVVYVHWGYKLFISCQELTYLCIPASDHSKQNMIQYFKDSIVFIHESRLNGKGCLVHCVAGVSRSVTLVVAYIMTVTGRGWMESLSAVRVVRPCAGPNLGFLRQLEEFEKFHLAEYRVWLRDRYKESPFNDKEDITTLLSQKFQATNDFLTITHVAPLGSSTT